MTNTVSSRTPEGEPAECPLCKALVIVEPSNPFGDAPCPNCGTLLWLCMLANANQLYESRIVEPIRDRILQFISEVLGIPNRRINLSEPLVEFGADSLEIVELIMALEEEFEVTIEDDAAENLKTVDEVIAYLIKRILDRRNQQ